MPTLDQVQWIFFGFPSTTNAAFFQLSSGRILPLASTVQDSKQLSLQPKKKKNISLKKEGVLERPREVMCPVVQAFSLWSDGLLMWEHFLEFSVWSEDLWGVKGALFWTNAAKIIF